MKEFNKIASTELLDNLNKAIRDLKMTYSNPNLNGKESVFLQKRNTMNYVVGTVINIKKL